MKTYRLFRLLGVVAAALGLSVAGTTTASAMERAFQVAWTDIGIYPRAAASMDSARVGAALPDGAWVTVECELQGQPVSNGHQTIDIWERLTDGTFLPNAFINTGVDSWTLGVPKCEDLDWATEFFAGTYNRIGAAEHARTFANTINLLPADCTFFVTLSMWDGGGLPQTSEWTLHSTDRSLWASRHLHPGLTRAAANANDFVRYMEESGTAIVKRIDWADNTASGAMLGDVIAYDWEGDLVIDHLAIVTSLTWDGHPFVSQHTPNQLDRYWSWSESAGNWIEFAEPGSTAILVHIVA